MSVDDCQGAHTDAEIPNQKETTSVMGERIKSTGSDNYERRDLDSDRLQIMKLP